MNDPVLRASPFGRPFCAMHTSTRNMVNTTRSKYGHR
jgi:hypothetical protein